jgi:hypothetical protein
MFGHPAAFVHAELKLGLLGLDEAMNWLRVNWPGFAGSG